MSEAAPLNSAVWSLHRRALLKLLPTAVAGSAISRTALAATPSPVTTSDIQRSLLRLWEDPSSQSPANIRQSTVEAINGMIAGRHAAFVSLWPPVSSHRPKQPTFYDQSSRFGRINVEVTVRRTTDFMQSQRSVERCLLLLGKDEFDSGNMLGFLRQYGPAYGQRFIVYKPFNDRSGYLIGTTDGIVPKSKQSVCIRDFRAENFHSFFELLRGATDQIDVERIRFPYRRPYVRGELDY